MNGGRDNLVTQNLVEDQEAFGIALLPSPDEDIWLTQGNEVRDNLVRNSGRADLALGAPSGGGDCFSGNDFSTSLPPAIEWRAGCGSPLARIPVIRWARSSARSSATSRPRSEMWPWATGARSRRRPTRNRCRAPKAPRPTRRSQSPPSPNPSASATPARSTCRRHPTSLRRSPCSGSRYATSWWGVFIGLYAYALPLILYSAWVSIALWDLVRQDAVPNRTRVLWMLVVLVIAPARRADRVLRVRALADPAVAAGDARGGRDSRYYVALTALAIGLGP